MGQKKSTGDMQVSFSLFHILGVLDKGWYRIKNKIKEILFNNGEGDRRYSKFIIAFHLKFWKGQVMCWVKQDKLAS